MSRREWVLLTLVVVLGALLMAALTAGSGGAGALLASFPWASAPSAAEVSDGGTSVTAGDPEYWTCSMHPSVHRDEEGTCPLCGMDLVPVYAGDGRGSGPGAAMPGMDGMAPAGVDGAGSATFRIDPTWQQAVGVRTATVERRPLRETLRLVGRVVVDESRLSDVNLRTAGWIERLHVDETGERVRPGEPLFDLYSPELVTAQRDLLLALDNVARLAGSPSDEARERARSLVDASRRRLRRLGLTGTQVDEVAAGGEPRETLPVLAVNGGYVLDKTAVEGMHVGPGMRLYRIADLDTVWVLADAYEGDVPFVRPGQEATFRLAYTRERSWRGHVDYVYPTLDADTRTVQVRLVFDNPGLVLRPDMYGDATVAREGAPGLAIPAEAVLDLGTRKVVYVDLGQGRLQAREVALGPVAAGWYPVRAGLAEGDTVVVSGNFLIDAESKVRGVVPLPVRDAPRPDGNQPGRDPAAGELR